MVGNGTEHDTHLSLLLAGCIVAISHYASFHCAANYTATHTVTKALWLLKNFLQHKVRETALLYLTEINVYGLYLRVEFNVLDVHHLQFLTEAHHSDVTILQINHLICIFDDRTGIRTEIKLTILSDTYNQRTLLTGSNDLIRVTLIKNSDSVGSDYLTESHLDGSQQVEIFLYLNIFNQLNENLSIRLALKLYSLSNEILLDIGIVFYDSIMNHGKVLARGIMRVSIYS